MPEMNTLAELVDLYLLRCDVEGKSPNTVRAYRWTLERFVAMLREDGASERADAIERDHIYAYLGRFTDSLSPRLERPDRETMVSCGTRTPNPSMNPVDARRRRRARRRPQRCRVAA